MIESLHIENLGVIEKADLAVHSGLTALTGETGAGKTMVLSSLGLLLGCRAEATMVRQGADSAFVEGTFTLESTSYAAIRAKEAGAQIEDDLLIAARTIPAQGRSRAYLGGRSVPSSVLTEVGAELVCVHGQSDQLRLRTAAAQRKALDAFGGLAHEKLLHAYTNAYKQHQRIQNQLAQWHEDAANREAKILRLQTWIERIAKIDPHAGEDNELKIEADRLEHAEDLRTAAASASWVLNATEEREFSGTDAVLSLLSQAERSLAAVENVDPNLAELAKRIRNLAIDTADISDELEAYLANLDADPERLAWVQERRNELTRAYREIGVEEEINDADALLIFQEKAVQKLNELSGPSDLGKELTNQLQQVQKELEECAAVLTQSRQKCACLLTEKVNAELEGLQMYGAQLSVDLQPLMELGTAGAETVIFRFRAHPDALALPLGKGASGGELSRIMLALEIVLAQGSSTASNPAAYRPTLVFDEIDAGVGGRAAGEIGRRLSRLARTHQVLVVTHLAQVAAWADTHLVVRKNTAPRQNKEALSQAHTAAASTTSTQIIQVEGDAREHELARMLSGHEESTIALRHAAELLAEVHVAQSKS